MGLPIHIPIVSVSHLLYRYLLDGPNRRSMLAISSSEHTCLSTNTASTSSITHLSGLDRDLTGSTAATMLTLPTTYSSTSGDEHTITEGTTIDYGDPYPSQLGENTPGPTQLCELHQSESAPSEATACSGLASEIGRLKSSETMEDATNPYAEGECYPEESLDSFAKLSLLSNIAAWLRDLVPRGTHLKGYTSYSRAFTGKDIVVCVLPRLSVPPLIQRTACWSSLRSSLASSRRPSSTETWRQIPARSRCKLRAVCNSKSSSMRSSGADRFSKTASRTCTCFSTTRRLLLTGQVIKQSCRRA
jgi:hypothetical protein